MVYLLLMFLAYIFIFQAINYYEAALKGGGQSFLRYSVIIKISDLLKFLICCNQDWVSQPSIKFKSQLNLKCKLILLYISSKFKCHLCFSWCLNLIELCATQYRCVPFTLFSSRKFIWPTCADIMHKKYCIWFILQNQRTYLPPAVEKLGLPKLLIPQGWFFSVFSGFS